MTHHEINSIVAVASKNGWITLGIIESRTEIQSRVGTSVTYKVWLLNGHTLTFSEECVTEFDVVTYASQHALFAPLYNSLSKELEKRKAASETENS